MFRDKKTEVLRFRVTLAELKQIELVSERLERNVSDSIRFLLRKACVNYFGEIQETENKEVAENASAI